MSFFSKLGRGVPCASSTPTRRFASPLRDNSPRCGSLSVVRRVVQAIALSLFFSVASPALRAETVVNVPTASDADVSIRLTAPWTLTPRFGFAPVRVTIENRGRGERSWRVHFEAGTRNLFPGLVSIDELIAVAAGQTRETWIFVPVAEPGVNLIPSGGMGFAPPPVVTITDTPTGKKVTVTRNFGGGGTYVTETEIDATTGTRTIKNIPASGMQTTRVLDARLSPGTTTTFVIDPASGDIAQKSDRTASKAAGPVKILIGAGTPATGAASAPLPGSAFVPSTGMVLAAEVSGPGVASGRHVFPGTMAPNGMRPFAISAPLEAGLRAQLSAFMGGAPNLSVVEVAQLPADWRVWSSFAGVVLTKDEYAGLDAARRSALRAWVALGGRLYLSPTAPAGAGDEQTSQREKWGAGTIVTFAAPLGTSGTREIAAASEAALRVEAEVAARRAARRPGATGTQVMPVVTAENAALAKDLDLFSGGAALPDRSALTLNGGALTNAVKDEPLENGWLAIFLVVFAIVIGPVNLFVFAPAQKRHRLFVTTPAIALIASLGLGATILIQDGTGGRGERRAVVFLLPGENAAAVVQEQAARTGFLVRRSFALPDDVALTVLPLDASMYYGGVNLELERGRGTAAGDWFQSRSRQAQQLRRITPTRARIEGVGVAPGGAPIVQSSLGATLREFFLVDANGKSWFAQELPAGQRVTLQAVEMRGPPAAPSLDGTANLQAIAVASRAMVPGRWWGNGGASELAPLTTLNSIRWKDANVLYTGALENLAATTTSTVKTPEATP